MTPKIFYRTIVESYVPEALKNSLQNIITINGGSMGYAAYGHTFGVEDI